MTTETDHHFATVLNQLLGRDTAIRLTVSGYMPLSVEAIGKSPAGNRLISICHYGAQHGDLMRDLGERGRTPERDRGRATDRA